MCGNGNVERVNARHDMQPWHVFDLHRYHFFQGLSTTGALLLLAQFVRPG